VLSSDYPNVHLQSRNVAVVNQSMTLKDLHQVKTRYLYFFVWFVYYRYPVIICLAGHYHELIVQSHTLRETLRQNLQNRVMSPRDHQINRAGRLAAVNYLDCRKFGSILADIVRRRLESFRKVDVCVFT